MKKKLLTSIFCLVFTNFLFSQCSLNGIVLNSKTKKPIPLVSVLVKNTKAGNSTNSNGVFNLNYNCNKKDSIVISSIGYKTKIVVIDSFDKINTIELSETAITLNSIVLSTKKNIKTLNKFNSCSSYSQSGGESFSQFAQNYSSPFKYNKIKKVNICKLRGSSNFRIIFYSYDSINDKPLKIIADTLISENTKKRKLQINLDELDLKIFDSKFLIAIEWLYLDINRYKVKQHNEVSKYENWYSPNICCLEKKADSNLKVWSKSSSGNWESTYNGGRVFQISVDVEEIENN